MIDKWGPLALVAIWGASVGFGIAWCWLKERERIRRYRIGKKWWEGGLKLKERDRIRRYRLGKKWWEE